MASHPIYQFRAELKDHRPKIWRRFQVMNNITMEKLARVIMTLYKMNGYHLFSFDMKRDKSMSGRKMPAGLVLSPEFPFEPAFPQKWRFEMMYEGDDIFVVRNEYLFDMVRSKVKDVVSVPKETMLFTYDFGDDWEIDVKLEKIIDDKETHGREFPRVLAGEGSGIIEDCGGVGGLYEIAEAFREKSGEKYEMYREWLGKDDIDLRTFDMNHMNEKIRRRSGGYVWIYEDVSD
jgi:hypothetical protein